MICPKCNAEISDDSLFCPKCGAKLTETVTATDMSQEDTANVTKETPDTSGQEDNPPKPDSPENNNIESRASADTSSNGNAEIPSENGNNNGSSSKNIKKFVPIIAAVVVVAICGIGAVVYNQPSMKYQRAEKAAASQNYEKAISLYENLGDYEDSASKLQEVEIEYTYSQANDLYNNQDYQAALSKFEEISSYSDSKEKIEDCNYNLGLESYANNDYLKAAEYFSNAGINDSSEKIQEIGESYLADEDYENAYTVFSYLNNQAYADYASGMIAFSDGKYLDAISAFKDAGNLYDAPAQLNESNYIYGSDLLKSKDYTTAKLYLSAVTDHADTEELINDCNLMIAKQNIKDGNLNSAKDTLESLPSDLTYNDDSVENLLGILNSHQSWVSLCGQWKCTSGEARVTQTARYGSYNYWYIDLTDGIPPTVDVKCAINDDGTVDVSVNGKFYIYTKYSSISAGLRGQDYVMNVKETMSSPGKITIDQYTSVTLSASQVSASYSMTDNSQDVYFTYTYRTNVTYGEKVKSY